jgi:hypothetical protein
MVDLDVCFILASSSLPALMMALIKALIIRLYQGSIKAPTTLYQGFDKALTKALRRL